MLITVPFLGNQFFTRIYYHYMQTVIIINWISLIGGQSHYQFTQTGIITTLILSRWLQNIGERISWWTNVRGNNCMGEQMSGVVIQRVNKCPPLAKITGEKTSEWTNVRIPKKGMVPVVHGTCCPTFLPSSHGSLMTLTSTRTSAPNSAQTERNPLQTWC